MPKAQIILISLSLVYLLYAQQFTYAPDYDTTIFSAGYTTGDSATWNNFDLYPILIGDINKDGFVDLVGLGHSTIYAAYSCGFKWNSNLAVIKNDGSYCYTGGWLSQNEFPRYLYDVNNDSYPDMIGFANVEVRVSFFTSSGLGSVASWFPDYGTAQGWNSMDIKPRQIADINGDGLGDIVAMSGGTTTSVSLGNKFSGMGGGIGDFGFYDYSSMDAYPRLLADVNGDNFADIVCFYTDGVYVALGNGLRNFFSKTLWLADFSEAQGWNSNSLYPRNLIDVNGDGKADIVGFKNGVWVALAGTGSFQAATQWSTQLSYNNPAGEWMSFNAAPRLLADVNCDGKGDIIAFSQLGSGIKVYLSGTSTTNYCQSNYLYSF